MLKTTSCTRDEMLYKKDYIYRKEERTLHKRDEQWLKSYDEECSNNHWTRKMV
jgi:hypothetical protein